MTAASPGWTWNSPSAGPISRSSAWQSSTPRRTWTSPMSSGSGAGAAWSCPSTFWRTWNPSSTPTERPGTSSMRGSSGRKSSWSPGWRRCITAASAATAAEANVSRKGDVQSGRRPLPIPAAAPPAPPNPAAEGPAASAYSTPPAPPGGCSA